MAVTEEEQKAGVDFDGIPAELIPYLEWAEDDGQDALTQLYVRAMAGDPEAQRIAMEIKEQGEFAFRAMASGRDPVPHAHRAFAAAQRGTKYMERVWASPLSSHALRPRILRPRSRSRATRRASRCRSPGRSSSDDGPQPPLASSSRGHLVSVGRRG
jgi:hypothetical protein